MPTPNRFRLSRCFSLVSGFATVFIATLSLAQPAQPTKSNPASPGTLEKASSPAPEVTLIGRYPVGDTAAPLQIVVFEDFQCGECQRLEPLLQELLAKRKDISLFMRHFPLCSDCNSAVPVTQHENACKAAIAAEAAGIAGGPTAFQRMHDWLFAVGGKFTDNDLFKQVQTLALDDAKFGKAISDGSALKNVHADINAGLALGLHTTPMVLINGEEISGWNAKGALDAACEAALKAKAEGKTSKPLTPVEKWTKDWEHQSVTPAASEHVNRWTGATKEKTKVEIILFGDFQERITAQTDQWLRSIVKSRDDVRYAFRQFPADTSCNPNVPKRLHPLACRFARSAEAIAQNGGPQADEAYWRTHDRIFAGLLNGKGQDFTDANLRDLADEFKIDPTAILKDRNSDAVNNIIKADIDAGKAVGITELPTIFINGKRVVHFRGPGVEDDAALKAIIDRASKP